MSDIARLLKNPAVPVQPSATDLIEMLGCGGRSRKLGASSRNSLNGPTGPASRSTGSTNSFAPLPGGMDGVSPSQSMTDASSGASRSEFTGGTVLSITLATGSASWWKGDFLSGSIALGTASAPAPKSTNDLMAWGCRQIICSGNSSSRRAARIVLAMSRARALWPESGDWAVSLKRTFLRVGWLTFPRRHGTGRTGQTCEVFSPRLYTTSTNRVDHFRCTEWKFGRWQ